MAIKFTKLKDPKLGLLDKIPFGKFRDCRVCDILEDNYAYVLWLHEKRPNLFSPIVIEEAHLCEKDAINKIHFEEEVKPWYDSLNPVKTVNFSDWDDDIPF